MGYRSNVAITAYGDTEKLTTLKAHYVAEVAKLDDESKTNLQSLLDLSKDKPLWDEKTGEFFFYICDVKWYDDYPVVALLNGVYTKATQLGLAAERVRVGEDLSDSEEEYEEGDDCCDYRLSIERNICF